MPVHDLPPYPCICPENPGTQNIQDYCELVPIQQARALCEYQAGVPYNWVSIIADNAPVVLCAFEKYMNNVHPDIKKADYLGVGWSGEWFPLVAAIEICETYFDELRGENQEHREADELTQVEQTLISLCKREGDPGALLHENVPPIFLQACDSMQGHKIVGIVIPVDKSRSRSFRPLERFKIEVEGQQTSIVPISNTLIGGRYKREITWSELMRAIGL